MKGVDSGHRMLVLRAGPVSVRLGVRTCVSVLVLLLLGAGVGVLALGTGQFTLPPDQVVEVLTGGGSRAARLVVLEWRLPRVLLSLLLGAALGVSGAVFQALLRNPLGSPDVLGFGTGAFTGVLLAMVFVGRGFAVTATGALVGGLATAAAVYLFAYRRGVQGFRLIVVGIGVSAFLTSLNQWFLIRVNLQTAMAAAVWGQGSLNELGWAQVGPAVAVVGALALVLLGLGGRLRTLELGDEAAAALGVRVGPVRLAYLAVGVALTAAATAVAGPVSFVALAAPQLARRLAGTAGIALAPAAATGALLLAGSDFLAARAFAPTTLPVGVVTVALGGVYLVWLLAAQGRRGR
ncbi:iron chelate uptake ABC transporter family permease subunit [Catellatospora sp. KI3]|uniref:FecCD family ABC transporter permease n=1 Tax=Catellatospora sp. KI3 TaxID=3041620 RepID=UPI0024829488|nr:iron chelate uptake ABC transporter family permease subunit [Catellatospora sp. KI3]MDI1461642.1 iron chelate uptake ABC transporter family permease subunit [Catellatospora sp. KI3]